MGIPVPQEVHFLSLLSDVRCAEWRHQIVAGSFQVANVATAQKIFQFIVPAQTTWIVTEIALEQLNPSPVGTSDFRSGQVDYNGQTNAWIVVNGTPTMAENAINSSALFNRPVLLAFQGGSKVAIWIQRGASSLPASAYEIELAINSYFAPLSAFQKLSLNTTGVQQP